MIAREEYVNPIEFELAVIEEEAALQREAMRDPDMRRHMIEEFRGREVEEPQPGKPETYVYDPSLPPRRPSSDDAMSNHEYMLAHSRSAPRGHYSGGDPLYTMRVQEEGPLGATAWGNHRKAGSIWS